MIDNALVCYPKLTDFIDDATLECADLFPLCQHVRGLCMKMLDAETLEIENLPADDCQRQKEERKIARRR
eukprot:6187625-Pyramimonas_sp.AAC.1